MYIAMPNTMVKWNAALLGTFIAGTLFQIARPRVRQVSRTRLEEL